MTSASRRLVVLYGIGGLSDVGRHAILAALEQPMVAKVTVITEYPELLDEPNWECGCETPHTNPSSTSDKVQVVSIDSWNNEQTNLAEHFQGADAVISCLGHRQPGFKHPELIQKGLVAAGGNRQVIQAMQDANMERVVVMSSVGIQEDWPPIEFHWGGKIMGWMFQTICKKSFQDLNEMEVAYKESPLDYLFIRPAGLGEDAVPVNKWFLQKEKFKDAVGVNMAKMDCARYMVQEALNPTRHKTAVTIGSEPGQDGLC
jgi:putative NADH-flavin reductase